MTTETQKTGPVKRTAKAAVSILLAGCLVGSLCLNIYQADRAAAQNQKVNKFIDGQLERQAEEAKQEDMYQEDGFVVADQYEIRSTSHISDAYINKDDSGLNDEEKQTLKMASDILEKIIKKDMDNYEKELAVYQWMFKHIGQRSGSIVQLPGTASNTYTPAGVLSGRNAVCVGYATTFRLFMNMLGMECHIVHNDYHSWDLVQLEADEWYHVDVYTDVSSSCEYQNFNMTDALARNGHEWNGSSLPEAKGVKYSYAVRNSTKVKDIYAVAAKLKKALDKKKSYGFYKFKKKLKQDDLGLADLLLNQANAALMSTPGFENYNISGNWYQDEQDDLILGIFMANYEESENANTYDMNSPEGQKITNSVSKAFGVDVSGVEYPENTEDVQSMTTAD